MTTRKFLAPTLRALFLFVLCAPRAQAQLYTFEALADTRSSFVDLSLFPSINASGTVAFRAETVTTGSAIYTASGGALQVVVDRTSFADFGTSDPKINVSGAVAFFANQLSGGSGIFVRSSGLTSTVADTSGLFSSGDAFAVFGSPSLNNNGLVAFTASSANGALGVFTGTGGGAPSRVGPNSSASFTAVASEVYVNGNGAVALIAESGGNTQVLTALPPAEFNVSVSTSGPLFSSIQSISPYLSGDGLSVVFLATRADTGERGIFRALGADITTLVDSTGAFQDFNDFALSADGSLLVFSAVTDDGRIGIFNGADAVLNKVIATGDLMAFGADLRQVDSVSFGESGLNDAGQIALYATFTDNPANGDPSFAALFRANPIPEPGVTALLVCGGAALFIRLRRKRSS